MNNLRSNKKVALFTVRFVFNCMTVHVGFHFSGHSEYSLELQTVCPAKLTFFMGV